jgi:hypothetical protein
MVRGNLVSDFPAPTFSLRRFCDTCGRQTGLHRAKVPASLTIPELTRRRRNAG